MPEVRQGKSNFRQLWVNGGVARSSPRAGKRHVSPGRTGGARHVRPPLPPRRFPRDWTRQKDLEIVVLQYWTEARLPLAKVEPATRTLAFTGGSWRPLTWSTGYYVENVFEAIGKPGQWYLDRDRGVVFYMPQPGEDMAKAEVIAPVLEQLVRLEGKPEAGQLVEHVGFQGLRFAHTAWPLPAAGLACPQAEISVSALWFAEGACRCRIEDCEFTCADSWAIELGRGCAAAIRSPATGSMSLAQGA